MARKYKIIILFLHIFTTYYFQVFFFVWLEGGWGALNTDRPFQIVHKIRCL